MFKKLLSDTIPAGTIAILSSDCIGLSCTDYTRISANNQAILKPNVFTKFVFKNQKRILDQPDLFEKVSKTNIYVYPNSLNIYIA